jgi:hypothetical protein
MQQHAARERLPIYGIAKPLAQNRVAEQREKRHDGK